MVMTLGYVKFSGDMMLLKSISKLKKDKRAKEICRCYNSNNNKSSQNKVNTKRASANNVETNETDEILVIEEQIEMNYKNESQKLVA